MKKLIVLAMLITLAAGCNLNDPGNSPPHTNPAASTEGLKLYYKCAEPNISTNQIKPHFKIVNEGDSEFAFADLTIRYYYTQEDEQQQTMAIDYTALGSENVTSRFEEGYVEFGFTPEAGIMFADSGSGDIQARFHKTDWTSFNQTDDYSFDPGKTSYQPAERAALYYKGTHIWPQGQELHEFPENAVVPFNDSHFENYIRESHAALQKGQNILYSDVKNIIQLNLPERVTNLEALKYFSSLKALYINGTPVNLNILDSLEYLYLKNLNVTGLDHLENLGALKRLSIQNCDLDGLSIPPELNSLQALILSGNNLTSITLPINLSELRTLDLSGNNLTDCSSLTQITSLRHLYLARNAITDIGSLSGLDLYGLDLSDNSLTDCSSLTQTTSIRKLYLDRNSIEEISPLSGLTSLRYLTLNNNSITDLTPIADLTLYEVSVGENPLDSDKSDPVIAQLKANGTEVFE